jgi:hypothetical protein
VSIGSTADMKRFKSAVLAIATTDELRPRLPAVD